jgi:uracil-DNA glycosylase
MTADDTRTQIAGQLLAWYEAMGVDAAVEDSAIDWLARGARVPGAGFAVPAAKIERAQSVARPEQAPRTRATAASPAQSLPRARQFVGTPPPVGEGEGRAALVATRTLSELEAMLRRFEGCGLKATAKNLCFYRGSERARLMIVGEAPGRDEDLEGKPFVGRAGMLLDKMLAAIGLSEADVHITNIVYWRPPGNRTPTPQEAIACRPFLERQVALVAPDVVLALGGAATKHLFDIAEGIMRVRGKWRDIEISGHKARAMATLHPAYLLRTPAAKGMAWRDLLAIKEALKTTQ